MICRPLTPLLLTAVVILSIPGQAADNAFQQTRTKYAEGVVRISREADEPLREADARFRRSLDSLAKLFQERGDLPGVLTVQAVTARFDASAGADTALPEDAPTELNKLYGDYQLTLDKIELERSRKLLDFARGYLKHLQSTVRKLTKDGDLAAAQAVQAEIDAVPESKAILRARTVVGRFTEAPAANDPKVDGLPDGLVLYYSFDTAEGRRVSDHSGKGNHGRVYNRGEAMVHTTDGKRGGAYAFLGKEGHIRCDADDSLDLPGPLTLSCWVYPRSADRAFGLIEGWRQYTLWVQQNNEIRFADNNGNFVDTEAGLLEPGKWHHVVGVFRGQKGDRLTTTNTLAYVNGVERGHRLEGTWSPRKLDVVKIGATRSGKFLLDEVMIFNRALSTLEVKSLRDRPAEQRDAPPPIDDPLAPIKPAPLHPETAQGFGEHWYQLFNESITWQAAQDRCKAMGGYLVAITTAGENQFVGDLARHRHGWGVWIGASDAAREGEWRWVSGEPFIYSNWYRREPNNVGGAEHAAILSRTGTWEDRNDGSPGGSGFVYEWDK